MALNTLAIDKPLELTSEDIRNIRITYVHNILIRFRLNDNLYEVEQYPFCPEEDGTLTNYIVLREYNRENNEYKSRIWVRTTKALRDMVVDVSKNRKPNKPMTYVNIDKQMLFVNLTNVGLFTGTYKDICDIHKKEQEDLTKRIEEAKKQIEQLEACKEKLYTKRLGPTGRGSKLYSQAFKGQISDRTLGTGYKPGTYIGKYRAKIGDKNKDKKQGGVLTDLRDVPYGTFFHCTNGDWYGVVDTTPHGDKAISVSSVLGDHEERTIRVTEENCVLYIKVI